MIETVYQGYEISISCNLDMLLIFIVYLDSTCIIKSENGPQLV